MFTIDKKSVQRLFRDDVSASIARTVQFDFKNPVDVPAGMLLRVDGCLIEGLEKELPEFLFYHGLVRVST